MKFKEGDRVKYMSGKYGIGPSNPQFNSKWNCVGTVVETDYFHRSVHVRVDWDNNKTNVYCDDDLAHWAEIHLPEELFEI